MVLRNLTTGHKRQSVRTQALVIGAGVAGLLVASQLQQRGIRTVLVESGSDVRGPDPHPLNEAVLDGQPYQGALRGRQRGLGGTSAVWGGALLPFLPCDLEPHTAGWPVDWPVTYQELEAEFGEIERLFRLQSGPYEVEPLLTAHEADQRFILRSAKWPAFRLRNVARVLASAIRSQGLEVWLEATATRFQLDEQGHLSKVTAASQSGAELEIEAEEVVIAAGAIESTRLLLLLDAQQGSRLFAPQDQLGRFLCDHLSSAAAVVLPTNWVKLNETFGIRFVERGGMRDLRLEPSPSLRRQLRLPGAFAHIAAPASAESGFSALRKIYRDLQRNSFVQWRTVGALSRDMGWLSRAVLWRFTKRRLLYPRHPRFELMAVIEQMPNPNNRVSLADNQHDVYGNPLAKITWRTSEEDFATFQTIQQAICNWWPYSRFAKLGRLQATPESMWRDRLREGCDIFHPGGTTRMGRSAATGIVDANLRAFRVSNLHVVSTSTFPSGGGANPTFMLMAFALRAANQIASQLERRSAPSIPSTQSARAT
jgi:choline dehydrogenase-like flavoprotein